MNPFANKLVVVPIDFSDEADRAVDMALEIAGAADRVAMIHVAPPVGAFGPEVVYMIDDDERHDRIVQAMEQRFTASKYRGIRREVRFGDPGDEIANFARSLEAGLIVMPSHGRTGLSHLLIGSVAERVVRLASCPVLVLRS